jgi:hypothetical protein
VQALQYIGIFKPDSHGDIGRRWLLFARDIHPGIHCALDQFVEQRGDGHFVNEEERVHQRVRRVLSRR